jgi:hypothetical protein
LLKWSLLRAICRHPEFPLGDPSWHATPILSQRTPKTMANLPPLPPAGRAPQGGQNAAGGKSNPKDSRAGAKHNGTTKQGGVNKATQSNRKQGDR